MARKIPTDVITENLDSHPATQAWMGVAPDSGLPRRIDVLKKHKRKHGVFRLPGVGPDGTDVIAKLSEAEAARVERSIYEDLLPHLSVSTPQYFGWSPSLDDSKLWIFLEDVTGNRFDRASSQHRALSAAWLSRLHSETAKMNQIADLPNLGANDYRELIHGAMDGIEDVIPNASLTNADRDVLIRIRGFLKAVHGVWDQIEMTCLSLPVVVMHGDFVSKNLAVINSEGAPVLQAFDWAEAHRGPLSADLAGVDLASYRQALGDHRSDLDRRLLKQGQRLGLLFRTISAVTWAIPALRYRWVDRSMRQMNAYVALLEGATSPGGWLERE